MNNIQGFNAAVYVAIFSHDYDRMMFKDIKDIAQYHMTGVENAIISNRIFYCFDLHESSMTLDTGCFGSFVALHQACQSLRAGETDLALVGGTSLILSPDTMIPMSFLQSVHYCF